MLSFSVFNTTEPAVQESSAHKAAKTHVAHPLDDITGGAFSAPTSGERSAKIRDWLATNPSHEQMLEVFKEMSARDKGAAKPLREKLDEIKRSASQEQMANEWAGKAQSLLNATKLNIADALAWQRDAAKAGAPLSKEPLATIRNALNERVKQIEDLQHRAQVQREAAMLLAQRIELLSTKPLADAQAAFEILHVDVKHWTEQTIAMQADAQWLSVDAKFTPQLEAAQAQLNTLWEAFAAALAQATAAMGDATAPLPAVPVWADAIRASRGQAVEKHADKPAKPKIDPEKRAAANAAVLEVLSKLEQELNLGHGKASVQVANDLRAALKEHGDFIDDKTEAKARDALSAAGELEGWQKWRANQIREELIAKAQELVAKPLSGRKQQETLRQLRESWKQTDQGGMPNHGLWRKFDEACNEAHKIVEAWLDKVKAEEAQHKAQRLAIIEEIQNWTAANAARTDWKAVDRELHAFSEKWRSAGHVGEKTFNELQPLYKAAIKAAHGPLEKAQKASLERRKLLIEEAKALGASAVLRIDAVKALQNRWQAEAQSVPLDRKEEQKLWDAFRKPIDEAFERKSQARASQAAAMSAHDKAVLDATKALEAAIASQDAKAIRAAMDALEATSRGKAPAASATATAPVAIHSPAVTQNIEQNPASAVIESAQNAIENVASSETVEVQAHTAAEAAEPAAPAQAPTAQVKVPVKPLVARRGDDRPGAKMPASAQPTAVRFGDKKGSDRKSGERADRHGAAGQAQRDGRREDRAPRLSNAAYYAMRESMDKAQAALKKLAAQAHGESIVALLSAWQERQADKLPTAQQLGRSLSAAARNHWAQAIAKPTSGDAAQALLRLEMAAEVPTPAEHLDARRALQLQLLTQRGGVTPKDTWVQDAASVLESSYNQAAARRLQNALKVLLR